MTKITKHLTIFVTNVWFAFYYNMYARIRTRTHTRVRVWDKKICQQLFSKKIKIFQKRHNLMAICKKKLLTKHNKNTKNCPKTAYITPCVCKKLKKVPKMPKKVKNFYKKLLTLFLYYVIIAVLQPKREQQKRRESFD